MLQLRAVPTIQRLVLYALRRLDRLDASAFKQVRHLDLQLSLSTVTFFFFFPSLELPGLGTRSRNSRFVRDSQHFTGRGGVDEVRCCRSK